MARVISLYLPLWPTERLRRQGGEAPPAGVPLVVAAREGGRRVVAAADAAARALGLRAGMTVAQAQAQVPGLAVLPVTPEADRAGLTRLALWLRQRVAPVVAVDGACGIILDVTGAAHLHGGEAALLDGLVGRLALSGVTARAALADTRGAAHALARFVADPVFIVPPGEVMAHLAPLPLAALRLGVDPAAGLDALGVATVGDLAALPRAPLTRRFGPEPCLRLDQALGLAADPVDPLRPEDQVAARRLFAEPIAAPETIARHMGKLAAVLCEALAARGLGARRLDLVCTRSDGQAQALRIGLARPSRDAAHLTRLLGARIERIDPGFGIESMALAASRAEPLAAGQVADALAGAQAPDLAGLVDTLANRVGPAGVYRMAAVASDVPERSVRRIPALADGGGVPRPAHRPVPRPAPWPASWPAHWPRPARLLPHPERIETLALLPDHPPAWFIWRGRRHPVTRADGPERIFGEWWKRDAELAAVRDYFRVEDDSGARFWIFRAGDGEDAATGPQGWFLHGLFG
ncbi:MAG: DNA polymerase Y family protein [Rubellimicrobium sp.]|nr:DNA polymerase Y family protein [Rubellimicrobium sp.]